MAKPNTDRNAECNCDLRVNYIAQSNWMFFSMQLNAMLQHWQFATYKIIARLWLTVYPHTEGNKHRLSLHLVKLGIARQNSNCKLLLTFGMLKHSL